MKQQDTKKDEDGKFKELVKRMKLFNELLSDYLDAIDMEEVEDDKEPDKELDKEDK